MIPRGIVTISQEGSQNLTVPTTFLNDLPSFQNVAVDKTAVFPIIYLDEPLTSNGEITPADAIRETYPVRYMFLNRDELTPTAGQRKARFDSTQQQHDLVITEMKSLSKEFITKLYQKKFDNVREIKEITGITWTNVRNEFGANLSGVVLEMDIELNNVDSVC